MTSFKDRILKNLNMNGFPHKRVSLPLETLYEKADEAGENLNKILEELACENIDHEKTADKIVFFQNARPEMPNFSPEFLQQAQEMMSKMDPEQLKAIQEKVMNMTPEERAAMMEQAKKMGLF
ncbi:MAG: hypothetical protein Fur0010_22000 [Bdellovibrio sp.]